MNKTVLQKTVQLCPERFKFSWILNRLSFYLVVLACKSRKVRRFGTIYRWNQADFRFWKTFLRYVQMAYLLTLHAANASIIASVKVNHFYPARIVNFIVSKWWVSFVIAAEIKAIHALMISLERVHRCYTSYAAKTEYIILISNQKRPPTNYKRVTTYSRLLLDYQSWCLLRRNHGSQCKTNVN